MDAVRVWATSVCMAALFGVVAGILSPNGNLEKIFKLCISVFFLTALVSPLFQMKDISLFPSGGHKSAVQTTSAAAAKIEKTMDEQIVKEAEKRIADLIRESVVEEGFHPVQVKVSLTKNGTKISVESADVWLSEKEFQKSDKLISKIKDEMKIDIVVKKAQVKSS